MKKIKLNNLTYKILNRLNMLLFITGMISIWLFPNFAIYLIGLFFFLNLVLSYLITSEENEEKLEEERLKKLKEKKSIEYYVNMFVGICFSIIAIFFLDLHLGGEWANNFAINHLGSIKSHSGYFFIPFILASICFRNAGKFIRKKK